MKKALVVLFLGLMAIGTWGQADIDKLLDIPVPTFADAVGIMGVPDSVSSNVLRTPELYTVITYGNVSFFGQRAELVLYFNDLNMWGAKYTILNVTSQYIKQAITYLTNRLIAIYGDYKECDLGTSWFNDPEWNSNTQHFYFREIQSFDRNILSKPRAEFNHLVWGDTIGDARIVISLDVSYSKTWESGLLL